MKKRFFSLVVLLGCALLGTAQQKTGLHLLKVHKIESDGGWDYLSIDQKNGLLYVSHGNQVNIINKNTSDSVGVIRNTQGVHGIAIANEFNKGYTSNGRMGSCTVFDLKTFAVIAQVNVGQNPDAIFFDSFSKKVFVFNGKSMDASVIDPKTDKLVATIPLCGKPETGVSDGKGKIYVNMEDTGEIICFDANTFKVLSRYKLKGGEEPSGLAIDKTTSRLFTVCSNKVMIVMEAGTGKELAVLPIGGGADGVVFDETTKTAYTSNGEGNITVVKELNAQRFEVQETIATKTGARTIALDTQTHHLFLPTADFEKAATANARPKRVPKTFQVLEFGK